jgi:tetratricopeptide (TPR) repeat protein
MSRAIRRFLAFAAMAAVLGAAQAASWAAYDLKMSPSEAEEALHAKAAANPGQFRPMAEYLCYLAAQGQVEQATEMALNMPAASDGQRRWLLGELQWAGGDPARARENDEALLKTKIDPELWRDCQERLIVLDYLEGKGEDCLKRCGELAADEPANPVARLYQARLGLRRQEFKKSGDALDVALAARLGDPTLLEARAELEAARGDAAKAKATWQAIADNARKSPSETIDGCLAETAALRELGMYPAAQERLANALQHAPLDPLALLAKARLFRRADSLMVAIYATTQILRRMPGCALAWQERGEIGWALRRERDVAAPCFDQALQYDPALLDARCRLIELAIADDKQNAVDELLKANRKILAAHVQTARLARAADWLKAGSQDPPAGADAPFCRLLGEIYLLRSAPGPAQACFARALKLDPAMAGDLKGAGVGSMHAGQWDQADQLLGQAFAASPYDPELANMLKALSMLKKSQDIGGDGVTVSFDEEDRAAAVYALALAHDDLASLRAALDEDRPTSARVQLCGSSEQIDILSRGMPWTCCGPNPQSELCMGNSVFIRLPNPTGAKSETYRFDEALYRGLARCLLERRVDGRAPEWLVAGLSGYLAMRHDREWASPYLPFVVATLRDGQKLSLDEAADESMRPLLADYAALLFEAWAVADGEDRLMKLPAQLAAGGDWRATLEKLLNAPLKNLQREGDRRILERYADLAPEPLSPRRDLAFDPLASATPQAGLEQARAFFLWQRYDDAQRCLAPLIQGDSPSPQALLLAGRVSLAQQRPDQARRQLELGLKLAAMSHAKAATAADYADLGRARLALADASGDGALRRKGIDALRQAIVSNPYDISARGALETVIEMGPGRVDRYYELLELGLGCRRADAGLRAELAAWSLRQGDREKALGFYRSAVGIRPDWLTTHRRLAALADDLADWPVALASYRVLHDRYPDDAIVAGRLAKASSLAKTSTGPGQKSPSSAIEQAESAEDAKRR